MAGPAHKHGCHNTQKYQNYHTCLSASQRVDVMATKAATNLLSKLSTASLADPSTTHKHTTRYVHTVFDTHSLYVHTMRMPTTWTPDAKNMSHHLPRVHYHHCHHRQQQQQQEGPGWAPWLSEWPLQTQPLSLTPSQRGLRRSHGQRARCPPGTCRQDSTCYSTWVCEYLCKTATHAHASICMQGAR
jgi:hypothetical protein